MKGEGGALFINGIKVGELGKWFLTSPPLTFTSQGCRIASYWLSVGATQAVARARFLPGGGRRRPSEPPPRPIFFWFQGEIQRLMGADVVLINVIRIEGAI